MLVQAVVNPIQQATKIRCSVIEAVTTAQQVLTTLLPAVTAATTQPQAAQTPLSETTAAIPIPQALAMYSLGQLQVTTKLARTNCTSTTQALRLP